MRHRASSCRISRRARCRPFVAMNTDVPRTSAFSAKKPAMSQTAISTTAERTPAHSPKQSALRGTADDLQHNLSGNHGARGAATAPTPRLGRRSRFAYGRKASGPSTLEGDMRRSLGVVGAATLLLAAAPPTAASPPRAGRFIVVLDDSMAPAQVAAEHASKFHLDVSAVYGSALRGYAATVPGAALAALRADPRVASVSRDRPMRIQAQVLPTGVNRIEGDVSSTRSGNGAGIVNATVAVIDTGIDVDHPELNVVGGKNCSTGSTFDDGNGHGTHVAGTIGARDNAMGVVGVAPGVRLYAVRVLDNSGPGTNSTVLCGIDFVDSRSPAKGGSDHRREHEHRRPGCRRRRLRQHRRRCGPRGDLPGHGGRRHVRGRRRQRPQRPSTTRSRRPTTRSSP